MYLQRPLCTGWLSTSIWLPRKFANIDGTSETARPHMNATSSETKRIPSLTGRRLFYKISASAVKEEILFTNDDCVHKYCTRQNLSRCETTNGKKKQHTVLHAYMSSKMAFAGYYKQEENKILSKIFLLILKRLCT